MTTSMTASHINDNECQQLKRGTFNGLCDLYSVVNYFLSHILCKAKAAVKLSTMLSSFYVNFVLFKQLFFRVHMQQTVFTVVS